MTILTKLGYGHGHVFDVTLSQDEKHLRFTEGCDMYYSIELTKVEVLQLAEELRALAEQLDD